MKGTRLVLAVMTLFAGNMNAGTEQQQIVDTVSTILAAARADDVAKFDSVIASDFYIFVRGARLYGDTLMTLINAQHASGNSYERILTTPAVHIIDCTTQLAALAYSS